MESSKSIPAEVQAVLAAVEAYISGEGDRELREAWSAYEDSLGVRAPWAPRAGERLEERAR